MQISAVPRKAPKVRIFQKDEIEDFKKQDVIHNFEDLSENATLPSKFDLAAFLSDDV